MSLADFKPFIILILVLGIIFLFLTISSSRNPIAQQMRASKDFVKAPFVRFDPEERESTFSIPWWLWLASGFALGWAARFLASLLPWMR